MTNIKPIINVQFMRAMAALAVLAYHFSFQYQNAGGSADQWFFYVFNQLGYAGVDFFFVISGYIMWVTTQQPNHQPHTGLFIYKRFTRIFFGYWPYFLLASLIILLYPSLASDQVNLTGSFFLTELNTGSLLIQVAWTLQYELYFYALFALILALKRFESVLLVCCLIVLILLFQGWLLLLPDAHWLNLNKWLNFFLSPYCLEFFAGCLMGYFFQHHRLDKVFLSLSSGLFLLAVAVYTQEQIIQSSLISHDHIGWRVLIYGTAAWLILAALIELELRGQSLLNRFSLLVGGASYSIYLSHTLVIALVYITGWQMWINQNSQYPGMWLLLIMLLTILYSIIHYIWIEKPLMICARYIQSKWFKQTS